MYVQEQGLSGNIFKKVGKALKKVAKPVAHIAAAYVTGGASLQLSAKMLQDKAARKGMARETAALETQMSQQTQENFDENAYRALMDRPGLNWGKNAAKTKAQYMADPWSHWTKHGKKAKWAFPYKTGASASSASWGESSTSGGSLIPYTPITPRIAQSAVQSRQYMTQSSGGAPSFDSEGQMVPADSGGGASSMPPWMIPAAIGGGALLLVLMSKGQK